MITAKFDLNLSVLDAGDNLYINFEYSTKLFTETTINRFITYFRGLFKTISNAPGQRIGDIEIITGEEKRQILYDFNDTAADYPREKTIHQLFEEQVEKTPDRISTVGNEEPVRSMQHAVGKEKTKDKKELKDNKEIKEQLQQKGPQHHVVRDAPDVKGIHESPMQHTMQITYRELNRNANLLAGHLRTKGAGRDDTVGILMERSLSMITGILATWKAGSAYIPLDPHTPVRRITGVLEDSRTKILI
ncbi:MAG: AMP-binding protein, partial [bacterium]|nr:AMP-binding protein [bacterium]